MAQTAVILLNYNNFDDTADCLASLEQSAYRDFQVYLVDNCSPDGSGEALLHRYGDTCRVICTDENLGYAGGNNIGLKKAYQDGCSYFCILNNDTQVHPHMLGKLVEYLQEHEDCGIVSPAIMEYNDRDTVQSTGGKIIFKTGNVDMCNRGKKYSELAPLYHPDYVGGACMVCTRKVLETVGYIPEAYFLFYEETEWCYQTRKAGLDVVCCIKAQVYHKGSVSVNRIGGLSEYLMERNRMRFVCRNAALWEKLCFICYANLRAIYRGIFRDKAYLRYLKFYFDGLFNRVDKKFSFIRIAE